MERLHIFYELKFKHQVCQEYLRGGVTKTALQNRYGIRGKSTLLHWLRQFGYLSVDNTITYNPTTLSKKSTKESEELKVLKQKLKDTELKLEAYQRMVAIAEDRFKIEIRKKSDTK